MSRLDITYYRAMAPDNGKARCRDRAFLYLTAARRAAVS